MIFQTQSQSWCPAKMVFSNTSEVTVQAWAAQPRRLCGMCSICSLFSSLPLRGAETLQLRLKVKWFTVVPLPTAIYKARGFSLEHYNVWLKWFSFLFLCWLDNFLSLVVCVSTISPGVKNYRQNVKTHALPSFERLFVLPLFLLASSLPISI